MKRIILMTVMITFLSLSSWAQKSCFTKFDGMDGVEYISLDRSMLEAAFQASSPTADITESLEKMESVVLITIDKPEADDETGKISKKDMSKALRKAYSLINKFPKKGYSLVVQTTEEDDKVSIYCRDIDGARKEFVVCNEDEEELIIVVVCGKLNADEAKSMISIKKN